MDTRFTKISPNDGISSWNNYFRAGDAWLESLQVLNADRNSIGWGVFYVEPSVMAFCLELFVKAIVAYEDKSFNGKKYRHNTTDILDDYKNDIPVFLKISNDSQLIGLIKEYENTIDTKFGETYVSINSSDQKTLVDVVYQLRKEMCRRTGLR